MKNSNEYKPKISVIMAVYNGMPLGPQSKTRTASSAYLPKAVESIFKQTYKNFEFIIVDDGSTDESWDYLESLKEKRIKLIQNKTNLGLAKSLNIALAKSTGDFIARMDADDINLPQRLEEQIKFLTKNPSIDICGTWADLIDQNDKIIGEKKYPIHDSEIKRALAWYPSIIHPTLMVKTTTLRELNGYDPKFDMAEEYELLMRARKKFKMANIPQKLLLWRLHDRRRSREQMHKMDKIDLQIKFEAFRRGDFGLLYLATVAKKFLLTYFMPLSLKISLAKLLKFA